MKLDPTLLGQLEQTLLQFASQASQIDASAPAWQRRDWFDSELFQSHSPQLLDYVQESMQLYQRLQQTVPLPTGLVQQNQQRLVKTLATQMQALARAMSAAEVRNKEKRTGKHKEKSVLNAVSPTATQRHRAGQLLAELGGSHQALYQKLSETHHYERRLLDMIQQAAAEQQDTARQLALHGRLGRCRKAISQLEAEIQWLEQRREK